MQKLLLATAFFLSLASPALAYTKPQNAPTLDLTSAGYAVTISVFAVQTGVGGALGVFEFRPASQDWVLCGQCITNPETPNLDGAVAAAGGGAQYIELKRSEMNQVLAFRYPAIGAPVTGLDRVNSAIPAYRLAVVNGSPFLLP